MPVFINEVVFRGDANRTQAKSDTSTPATQAGPTDRAALVAEIMQQVIDQLERERDRIGER
jgi:hypothetical protein